MTQSPKKKNLVLQILQKICSQSHGLTHSIHFSKKKKKKRLTLSKCIIDGPFVQFFFSPLVLELLQQAQAIVHITPFFFFSTPMSTQPVTHFKLISHVHDDKCVHESIILSRVHVFSLLNWYKEFSSFSLSTIIIIFFSYMGISFIYINIYIYIYFSL